MPMLAAVTPIPIDDPPGAFVALLPRLRRLARFLAETPEAGDDLAARACERVLRTPPRLATATASPHIRLFRALTIVWLDVGATPEPSPADGAASGDSPPMAANDQPAPSEIRDAIATLSRQSRLILGLILVDSLSYKEAAEILDVPFGTVMTQMARARHRLFEALSPTLELYTLPPGDGAEAASLNIVNDERLVAYIDREFDEQRRAGIAAVLARSAFARERAAMFGQTGLLVRRAVDFEIDQKVPERLLRLFDPPVPEAEAPPAAPARSRYRGLALAACAAGIAVVAGTAWLQRGVGEPGAAAVLQQALEASASGTSVAFGDGEVMPLLTLRDADGRYCRQYRMLTGPAEGGALRYGLACRGGAGWTTEVTVAGTATGTPEAGAYRPASGAGDAGLSALDTASAGYQRLAPAEERALLAAGWTRR